MTTRFAIDLGCGRGGWTRGLMDAGLTVYGFDIVRYPDYPGRLVLQDVRTVDGRRFRDAALIVASMPCDEFSRWQMPWTRARNPPEPDLSLIEACWRIRQDAGVPFVMENVRSAERWIGKADAHIGPFYLWGDIPALLPYCGWRKKESYGSKDAARRAMIPRALARHIGECYYYR